MGLISNGINCKFLASEVSKIVSNFGGGITERGSGGILGFNLEGIGSGLIVVRGARDGEAA